MKVATIILALFIACATPPSTPDAGDSHALRVATKELCSYRANCQGLERDQDECRDDVLECGVDEIQACLSGTCEEIATCLTTTCLGMTDEAVGDDGAGERR